MATRPRGVRPSRPSRTRNGSATVSTVSGSSPTATASVDSPTGPPSKRRHRASSTDRSSRSSPRSSTVVHLQGRPCGGQIHHAVTAHLGPVTHPAQQPVGDPWGATRATGDLGAAVVGEPDAEQAGRAGQHLLQFVGGVEVEVTGEPEPVAQRSGQQAGPRRGADDGERRQVAAGSRSPRGPCRPPRRPGSPPSRRRASPRPGGPSGGSRRGRAPHPSRARTGRRPGHRRAGSPGRW